MKDIIAWFVKNPVAANLIMALMFLLGFQGYNNLDREFFPQTPLNGITVSTTWQGASPRDVEEQLVVRIEEAVDGLDGVESIESRAREGVATVTINGRTDTDFEKLLDEVKSRVDAIQNLPQDSFRPEVTRQEARPDILFLALHGDLDRLELQREATQLRQKITELTGLQLTEQVSKVAEQVTIEISEDALRQYNLTFSQVAQAISGTSVNLSAGTVQTSGGNLQLRARNLANSEADFEKIIVRQTPEGGIIRVRDIANVIDRFENDDFGASFRGKNTAIFKVFSPDNLNITEAGKAIRKFEKEINESLRPDLTFTVWSDLSRTFDSRMELIGSNAISGLVLVLLILILFLRPAVALWVTIGIFAAFMGAIGVAPYLGITLNMISLFAFLLVIGIVVDDAIVVGESTFFHVENGVSGERGAIAGTNMVVKPVFFGVITTIMMFIPFMLLTGPMRAMTSQISLVVIAVLIFSLIEAFLILPAHLRHLKPVPEHQENRLLRFQNKLASGLMGFAKKYFRPYIAMLIRFRYYTVATFLGLMILACGLLAKGFVPVSFLPEVEADMITFEARLPEGTTFERMEQIRRQLEAGIVKLNENTQEDFGVDHILIEKPGAVTEGRSVNAFLQLIDPDLRANITTKAIADKLEEYVGPVPDAYRADYGTTRGGSGGSSRVSYGLASSDPEALKLALYDIKEELDSYDIVKRSFDSLESSASEVQFTLKPGAETLGITLTDVTRQVREAFFGREVQRLPRGGEDVRVMVRYPKAARDSIDSLKNLRIRAANGVEVPVFAVADVAFTEGAGQIRRRDRKRQEFVGALTRGKPEAVAELKRAMNEEFLPAWKLRHPNVARVKRGNDEVQATMVRELKASFVVIILLMYGLLAVAFRSYAQPFLIIIALPFAFVGMIFGNLITGVSFGMMSILGFFAASGVAVNDNLVLIDYVNRLRAKGVGAYQAMLDACVARFRPILLTSLTTFIGITPILFETSTQAEFLKPMVVALAFGVLFDFFLTLMLVPALYGIGVDITRFCRGLWRGEKQPPFGSTYNPDIALALDEMELDEDIAAAAAQSKAGGASPLPAE